MYRVSCTDLVLLKQSKCFSCAHTSLWTSYRSTQKQTHFTALKHHYPAWSKKSLECTSRDNQYAGDFEIEVKCLQKHFSECLSANWVFAKPRLLLLCLLRFSFLLLRGSSFIQDVLQASANVEPQIVCISIRVWMGLNKSNYTALVDIQSIFSGD